MRKMAGWILGWIGAVILSAGGAEDVYLSLPDLTWALEITAPGFKVEEGQLSSNGNSARLQAVNEENGVFLTAFLEKAEKNGGASDCREYFWSQAKKSPFPKEQVTFMETGEIAVVQYYVPDVAGRPLKQLNLNAYLSEGGYWMDVHLSKSNWDPSQENPLQPVLNSIRIRRDFQPAASDCFAYGNAFYHTRNFPQAIRQFEKALALEKAKPTLNPLMWKVLVDQLGMAYGISGQLEKSKTIYEWAIQQEPEYPMFFYNLACTYAEMGKKNEAVQNLKLAYQYEGNSLPGESVPDPLRDSSFAKYSEDPEFLAELKKMKPASPLHKSH
jgi:tetratricopeptide (TPR) repeat protein